jgi:hypothetical protein
VIVAAAAPAQAPRPAQPPVRRVLPATLRPQPAAGDLPSPPLPSAAGASPARASPPASTSPPLAARASATPPTPPRLRRSVAPLPKAEASRRRSLLGSRRRAPRSATPTPRAVTQGQAPAAEALSGQAAARYGVAWGVGASGGVLPGVAAHLELEARLQEPVWGVSVAFRYWPERSHSREGRGLDVSALGGRAAALLWVAPRVQLLGGMELNRLAGAPAAGVSGRSAAAAWQLAPNLGVQVIVWGSQHLRLELGGAGRLSLLRPRFVVTGFGDLYRVPVFGADAILRGVWLF